MAQTGFTPISIYYSSIASNVPTAGNLVAGELAINTADGKLFYKDSAGVVQVIGTKGGVGSSTTTQVLYNTSGLVVGSANLTFNGTTLTTANDASISGLTVGKGGGAVASNSAIGTFALANNSSGTNNTASGYQAGYSNTTGAQNSSFGQSALLLNTTGSANTALGYASLNSNTTASKNTAVGYQAGYTAATSTGNTFLGYQAGYSHNGSAGEYSNTCVGYNAGLAFTGGYTHTLVGYNAGSAITTGVSSVIIGSYTGNSNGLDIRTANNYAVISEGSGVPLLASYNAGTVALQGAIPNAGCGITFPATQVASSNANTLDDYEEGTWTPNQGSGLTVVGAFSSSGSYTKIGNQVTIYGKLNGATSISIAAATSILCSNIPFSSPSTSLGGGVAFNSTSTSGSIINIANPTTIYSESTISSAVTIWFSVTYTAA
jgi:hypothetical protein